MTALDDKAATATKQPASAAQFEQVLYQLLIIWPRDGEPSIGPITETTEQVAVWLEDVLNANPALVAYVHAQFPRAVEVVPGVLVLPVASLREALLLTLRDGTYLGQAAS